MAFNLPTFNLTVNIWRASNPTTNPPNVISVANFARGRRVYSADSTFDPLSTPLPPAYLLLPTGTDIQGDVNNNGNPDVVEIPAASRRFYKVHYVDYAGMGFPNEHLVAVVTMIPGLGPPIVTGTILDETSGDVLMEDATPILLE